MKKLITILILTVLAQSTSFAGGGGFPQPISDSNVLTVACSLKKEGNLKTVLNISGQLNSSQKLVRPKGHILILDTVEHVWTGISPINSKGISGALNTSTQRVVIQIESSKRQPMMSLSFSYDHYSKANQSTLSFVARLTTSNGPRNVTTTMVNCFRDDLAINL